MNEMFESLLIETDGVYKETQMNEEGDKMLYAYCLWLPSRGGGYSSDKGRISEEDLKKLFSPNFDEDNLTEEEYAKLENVMFVLNGMNFMPGETENIRQKVLQGEFPVSIEDEECGVGIGRTGAEAKAAAQRAVTQIDDDDEDW